MRYAIYDLVTQELLRDVDTLEYDASIEGYKEVADSYFDEVIWSPYMLRYIGKDDPTIKITSLEFIHKFTQNERVAIHAASSTSPILKDLLYMTQITPTIDLCSKDTKNGTDYLAYLGILTPERVLQIRGY